MPITAEQVQPFFWFHHQSSGYASPLTRSQDFSLLPPKPPGFISAHVSLSSVTWDPGTYGRATVGITPLGQDPSNLDPDNWDSAVFSSSFTVHFAVLRGSMRCAVVIQIWE